MRSLVPHLGHKVTLRGDVTENAGAMTIAATDPEDGQQVSSVTPARSKKPRA